MDLDLAAPSRKVAAGKTVIDPLLHHENHERRTDAALTPRTRNFAKHIVCANRTRKFASERRFLSCEHSFRAPRKTFMDRLGFTKPASFRLRYSERPGESA